MTLHQPYHWTTGVKVDPDGRSRYKCEYICECGNRGTHYIPTHVNYVTCHECGYHLYVSAVGRAKRGILARDKRGNYFTAYF